MLLSDLSLQFDPLAPLVPVDADRSVRRLSDLAGSFADQASYEQLLKTDNPLVYQVSTWEVAHEDGDLGCGFGTLFPGKVGDEYFLTRGHYHVWREAAEIYIGLSGEGYMLLEHETSHDTQFLPLGANRMIYVPGYTAHRTINVGTTPLTYLGIYPIRAGHDYAALAETNFRKVVVARGGQPVLIDRSDFLHSLKSDGES